MEDPVLELKTRVEASSQAQVAEDIGVTQQYISAVLTRARPPGKSILRALGLERSIVYVRANGKAGKRAGR
jgi:transcriptional regulator with XRE-family HTH domain